MKVYKNCYAFKSNNQIYIQTSKNNTDIIQADKASYNYIGNPGKGKISFIKTDECYYYLKNQEIQK